MKHITADSPYISVLRLLSYCGEFHPSLIKMLPMKYNTVMKLIKRSMNKSKYQDEMGNYYGDLALYKIVGQGEQKSIMLTREAEESKILDIVDGTEFYELYNKTALQHNNEIRRRRNHYLGEIVTALDQVGVSVFPQEKFSPGLVFQPSDSNLTLRENMNVFYSNREIKFYTGSEIRALDVNIKFGSYYGLWFCRGRPYVLYHPNKNKAVWNFSSEGRTVLMLTEFLKYTIDQGVPLPKITRAVFIGKGKSTPLMMLRKEDERPFILGRPFLSNHYVPVEHYKDVLSVIQFKNYDEIMKKICFGKTPPIETFTVECHGITSNSEYLLAAFDFDLSRLRRLKLAMDVFKNSEFVIVCFPWMVEIMREYFGQRLIIKTISAERLLPAMKRVENTRNGITK